MKPRISLLLAVGVSLFAAPACALNCKAQKADFQQGQKDGAVDAKESYPKDVNQHGYAASASDGLDGQCYRCAYNAAYDKARKGVKGATSSAGSAPAPKGKKFTKYLFSPASGVICDTLGLAYCVDGTGISASFTEQYLGPEAAKKLSGEMNSGSFDPSSFVMSNRIQCRTKEKACFKSKNGTVIDPVFTQLLFP
jgi:hypothetical protein